MGKKQKENLDIDQKETVCRTLHQYNKEPLSDEDMRKLQEIAEDYRRIKNYVYTRYGGVGSLSKLYPGYTVQNEMTASGLRADLSMPSVYFYRAIFDALGDIKSQWARTKTKIGSLIAQNENLLPQEKHYLRFLIRVNNAFDAALNQKPIQLPQEIQVKYEELASQVDVEKMHRYLCRQVRKYHVRNLCTDKAAGFFITGHAYRYGIEKERHQDKSVSDRYGIFIATKENRKRVFIPLTDNNAYEKQLYIKLKPEENGIEIHIPVQIKVRIHRDYLNEIGLSVGIWGMFTTHEGHIYGEQFGKLHGELTEYISKANVSYRREKNNNVGRKKYKARKAKLDAKLETYINQEINRMLEQEKPKIIYLPKLPGNSMGGYNKKINYSIGIWKKGLIKQRLQQKCTQHTIELVEVFGKGISTECSNCGAVGAYSKDTFFCSNCGYETDKKINAAKNALKRGQTQYLNKAFVSGEEAEMEQIIQK